jgi:hypothetical protein
MSVMRDAGVAGIWAASNHGWNTSTPMVSVGEYAAGVASR